MCIVNLILKYPYFLVNTLRNSPSKVVKICFVLLGGLKIEKLKTQEKK